MEETPNNQKAGLKYFLFIGIPVILILGILGTYYYITNPLTLITKTINTGYEQIEKLLNDQIADYNTIEMNGNLTINSNNIKELEELNKYNFDISMGIDLQKEITNLGFGMKKEQEEILNVNFYNIEEKIFLESTKLYDKLIELPTDNFIHETTNKNITKNENKTLIKKSKDFFIASLNENYIEREKVDIKIDNDIVKTTKITYLLDEKNQKRTLEFLIEKMLNDQEYLEILSKMRNCDKNDTITYLKQLKQNFNWQQDYQMNIFTEGLKQNIIKISLTETKENIITYQNYKNQKTINILDNLTLILNKTKKEDLDIDYTLKEEKINGKIKSSLKETNQNQWESTFNITINYLDYNLDIHLDSTTKTEETIKSPNTENSIKYEELTQEEMLDIFIKLENILKDTFLYQAIENNIM